MDTERKRAPLGASSAHIWLHCTPSARLGEKFPDSASKDAAEGTLAHKIAELKLRKAFIEPMGARTFNTRMNKLKKDPLYQEEMQGHTDTYIEYITECAMKYERAPTVAAETRLDYSAWVPEGFGTGDAVIVGDDTLQIVDFKYGKGVPVSVKDNAQLRLYALGALGLYSIIYPISRVKMAIVQPRLDSITEDEITVKELLDWAENVVKPAALLAWEGKGEFHPCEDADGGWCRFCRAKSQCSARAYNSQRLINDFGAPPDKEQPVDFHLLTNDEIGNALRRAEPFIKWVKDVKEYALAAILRGETVPGWKAVEGRSNRVFTDVDKAFAALLEAGFDEALLYKPKEHITLTEAEKLAGGRAKFTEICGKYVTKPYGAPKLASEDDKSPPYDKVAADFQDAADANG